MTEEQIKVLSEMIDTIEDNSLKHKLAQLISQGKHGMELTSKQDEPLSFNGRPVILDVGVSMDGEFNASALLNPIFNFRLVEDMNGVLVMIITPKSEDGIDESLNKLVEGGDEDAIDALKEEVESNVKEDIVLVNEDGSVNCAGCGVRMSDGSEVGEKCVECD